MMLLRELLVVLFVSLPVLPLFSFELKIPAGQSPANSIKWTGSIPVTLYAIGSSDLPLMDVENSLIGALDVWQKASGESPGLAFVGTTDLETRSGDRINTVQWVEQDWSYSSFALAVTRYSYFADDPFTMVDADVMMNGRDHRWAVGRKSNSDSLDVRQVLTHELGHLLGLAHTGVVDAQMYPYLPNQVRHELALDDAAGVRYLYGPAAAGFRLVTPVKKAVYLDRMHEKGIPLPIIRWSAGPVADYILEFSASKSFDNRVSFSAGPNLYFALTRSQEKKIRRLAKTGAVYWRVRSGSEVCHIRKLRFIRSS